MINIDGYLKHTVRAIGHSDAVLKGRRNFMQGQFVCTPL